MYQAITTKYLGPTHTRSSRIKASCAAGSLTIECDNRWNQERNHTQAAMRLARKLDWDFKFYGGCDRNGDYVFVSEGMTYFTKDYEANER
jgi:hypothetical protein